ncbi:hypothetical protein EV361DRAFT_623455 [Lentinula raphanica]|nr:hypothetical protein EV361DRAFT_623455 [Lentinula raphanica]
MHSRYQRPSSNIFLALPTLISYDVLIVFSPLSFIFPFVLSFLYSLSLCSSSLVVLSQSRQDRFCWL